MRVGSGFDAHRFNAAAAPLRLCGVIVDGARGVAATSDGDVAAHAIADALLGAAALGDLGVHFPSDGEEWVDADSMQMLSDVVGVLAEWGFAPSSVDLTVVAEDVRIAPHRDQMRAKLAAVLGVDTAMVSVKATSTDGMGSIGAGEGIAAMATAVVAEA